MNDYILKYEIWDTAGMVPIRAPCAIEQTEVGVGNVNRSGQERYRSLAPMYYRGAAAALVVYDITDHVS